MVKKSGIVPSKRHALRISDLIKRNANFLHSIGNSSRAMRKCRELMAKASTEEMLCLVEICLNILRNRVPLKSAQRVRLRRNAQHIRALSRVRTSPGIQRVLIQSGKGAPALMAAIASVVVPLITEYINKKLE